jgi:hypothetical protein
MTATAAPALSPDQRRALLAVFENLSRNHHEHEKYYSESPLHDAASLQRTSRALKALAEHWERAEPGASPTPSPFAGADDLNDQRAIETNGILFMESGEAPAEIQRIQRELPAKADSLEGTGKWLSNAMDATWGTAAQLLRFPELADLLAERHRIIANDWESAGLQLIVARQLRRANDILATVDFSTAALRANLAGDRHAVDYVFSAAELIDQAADLTTRSATLVHDNERRWRVFHRRVEKLLG